MNRPSLFKAALFIALASCATQPQLTSLQKQELQSREFENAKRPTFNGCVSVLQDIGYIIDTADFDTGVISARGESESNLFLGEFQTRVSIFVQEWGPSRSKVRATFVQHRTSHGQYGSTYETDETIYDAAVYQNFFNELGKTLFVQGALGPQNP
ncbi:MAG: hypothetical protein ACYTG2_15230 [Planctomycetota bacterium]|jgi:hypothetical protein